MFNKFFFYSCFLLVLMAGLHAQQPSIQWEHLIDGEGKMDETGFKITGDEEGNFYVLGTSMLDEERIYLSKYNAEGAWLWSKYPEAGSSPKNIRLMNGSIYIGYYALNVRRQYRSVVIEFNPNGDVIYTYEVAVSGAGDCKLNDFEVDNQGNIIMVGRADTDDSGIEKAFIAKLKKHGEKEWMLIRTGTSQIPKDNEYVSLFIDNNNDIYISGTHQNELQNADAVFAKISSSGVVLWQKEFDNQNNIERSVGVVQTTQHGFYEAIYSFEKDNQKILVIQYDAEGSLHWTQTYALPDKFGFNNVWLDSDENGNLYVGCLMHHVFNTDSLVIFKYNPKGELLWLKHIRYNEPLVSYMPGFQLKVYHDHLFLITSHGPHDLEDARLSIFDLDGNLASTFDYNSSFGLDDEFKSIYINPKGDIILLGDVNTGDKKYVGNFTKIGVGGTDLLILKLKNEFK